MKSNKKFSNLVYFVNTIIFNMKDHENFYITIDDILCVCVYIYTAGMTN